MLKAVFREKYPTKSEPDLNALIEGLKKQGGIGKLDEPIWKKVITRMYDERDS